MIISQVNIAKPIYTSYSSQPLSFKKNTGSDVFVRSNISFTSQIDGGADGDFMRSLKDVPCPCCGEKMISGSDVGSLDKDVLNGPSLEAIKILKPYEDRMKSGQKNVFAIIEEGSKAAHDKTILEILKDAEPKYKDSLKKNRLEVINNLGLFEKKLPLKVARDLHVKLKNNRNVVETSKDPRQFKHKNFRTEMEAFSKRIDDKDTAKNFLNVVKRMPLSSDDTIEIFTKYYQKSLTPAHLAKDLLMPSVSSIEHIHPRNPKGQEEKGENTVANYLWECTSCNTERANMPFAAFVKLHPQMKNNIQKYIDAVIEKINNKEVCQDYKDYPTQVAETLDRESKGQIILDTSKLL